MLSGRLKKETPIELKEVNFFLWQSLIAINSLFATLLLAIAAFKTPLTDLSKGLILVGFVLSTISCVLLVSNFKKMKEFYSKFSEILERNEIPLPKEEEKLLSDSYKVFELTTRYENFAFVSSTIGWGALVFLIYQLIK